MPYVRMGPDMSIQWGKATPATGGDARAQTAIKVAEYSIVGGSAQVYVPVFPGTEVGSAVAVEGVVVGRKRQIRGEILVRLRESGGETPKMPGPQIAELEIGFDSATPSSSWKFAAHIVGVAWEADPLGMGPQVLRMSFVSSGTSEVTIA